jgi:hypothetical protein
MEEFDTTTPKKTESERLDAVIEHMNGALEKLREHALVCEARIEALDIRVANLEVRKTILEHRNDDEEWF